LSVGRTRNALYSLARFLADVQTVKRSRVSPSAVS
jgi:hypothetical protein